MSSAISEEVQTYLREKYPNCFNDNYLLLKIGIHEDILNDEPPFTKKQIRRGLVHYTRHEEYQAKLIQAGHPRYDLAGEVCGAVSEPQAENVARLQKQIKEAGGWEAWDKLIREKVKRRSEAKKEARRKEQEAKNPQLAKNKPEEKKTTKKKSAAGTGKDQAGDKKVVKKPVIKTKTEQKVVTEPVIKTKKMVKVSLSEQRDKEDKQSTSTTGKKKLTLKKK